MKKPSVFARSLILTLVILVIAIVPALAGSTTKTLSTNYTVVNLGSVDASVTALYYKDTGATWTADADKTNFTVGANYGQKVIAQYFDSTLSSGKGSVVLSSTEPLAAVVQIQARGQTASTGAYTGYTSGSNKFYIPLVLRQATTANGVANTQIMIQNIMNETITAGVEFIPNPATAFLGFTKPPFSIPPYSTQYYDVADELASNLPNGWIGSAVVTAQSGKQIAVVVNIFTGADGMQTLNAFPVESIGTSWAVPQFASRLTNSFNTPINVQNVSGGSIAIGDLDLDCVPAAGYVGTVSKSNTTAIPNNATYGFNPVTDLTILNNWQGACKVVASGNIVTFVQLRRPGVTSDFSAYEAFRSDSTNTKVVVPLVAKRLANGFATAVTIQNLSTTTTANVTLTFTRAPGIVVGNATYTMNQTIAPNANAIVNMRLAPEPTGLGMPDTWQGTLVVTTQAAQTAVPTVAYVQLTNINILPGDNWMAHDAFSVPEP